MNDPYDFLWNELFEPKDEKCNEFEVELKEKERYYEAKYKGRYE